MRMEISVQFTQIYNNDSTGAIRGGSDMFVIPDLEFPKIDISKVLVSVRKSLEDNLKGEQK